MTLEEENEKLKQMLRSAFPEKSGGPFICGIGPDAGTDGLPNHVLICVTYGSDVVAVYERKTSETTRKETSD